MRELRQLERQIRAQRQKVADDQRRVERAVAELPGRALDAIGSPSGLLVSFSLGAATAAASPAESVRRAPAVASLVMWDLVTRVVLHELPALGDFINELRGVSRGTRPA